MNYNNCNFFSGECVVCFQDMSSGRRQDMSSRHVFKTSSRLFSVTIFCLPRRLQDVLRDVLKTSWRRLKDILRDVVKTSWKTKNCYAEDVLETRRLQDQQMFAGKWYHVGTSIVGKQHHFLTQKNEAQ